MKQLFTFVLVVFVMLNSSAQNVGGVAPDFTLKTLNNQDYTLSGNRGKVLLVFLIGYNCPLCIASAPTVKSKLIDEFIANSNFQAIIIDTWDGSSTGVQNFKNSTNLSGIYLQKGSKVATNWSTTYDRLVVIDSQGIMVFKGNSNAGNDAEAAKAEVEKALNKLVTSVGDFQHDNQFSVEQNYPNPFSNQTEIKLYLPEPETVSLKIMDVSGKELIQKLQQFPAGKNALEIKRDDLTDGIYYYRVEASSGSFTGKMIVQ
ncbi:MAG TPA: T9SS type A sorting domain-containing protein [Prolixibacteraceae bacterium]|nr:T9SS type A sorting domain-containing protein [Prolixibacteraceae bacterium]